MDRIKKFLKKLPAPRQDEIDEVLRRVQRGDVHGLDVRKLKGQDNLFRVRVGDVRIVFCREGDNIDIVFIGRRTDTTYKKFRL